MIDMLRMLKFTLLSVTEMLGIIAAERLLPHFLVQVDDECCLSSSASELADVCTLSGEDINGYYMALLHMVS